MPKIIENVREQLLAEAKKQITERGYAATTVRSVANACGIAVGTVYNYFKSKDLLIASFVAEDWIKCVDEISACPTEPSKAFLHRIYGLLRDFSEKNASLFGDPDAAKVYYTVFSSRHKQLRDQLADLILPVCGAEEESERRFLSQFTAESVLTWTSAGVPFEKLYKPLEKLLKK